MCLTPKEHTIYQKIVQFFYVLCIPMGTMNYNNNPFAGAFQDTDGTAKSPAHASKKCTRPAAAAKKMFLVILMMMVVQPVLI
jgi:hypothetical protein